MTARAGPPAAAVLLVLALVAPGPARADEVLLRDGTEVVGEVVGEDDAVVRLAVVRRGDRVVIEIPREAVRVVRRLTDADERLAREAEAALLAGDHAAAVAALTSLTAARRDDARAHRELGFALLLANRDEEAAAALGRACALDPIDAEAALVSGQALVRLGRRDEAIDAFRRAARLAPRHLLAWRALARLLAERAGALDVAEAHEALRRATQQAPDDEGLLLERVDLLLAASRASGASGATGASGTTGATGATGASGTSGTSGASGTLASDLEAAGRCEAEALDLLRAFLARGRPAPQAARVLAHLEARAGDLAGAAARLEAAAALPLPDDLRAAILAQRAYYAWRLEPAGLAPAGLDAGADGVDLGHAGRALEALAEAWPDDARLALARARVALRAGDPLLASAWLERAALGGDGAALGDALLLGEVAGALLRAEVVPGAPALGGALLGPDASLAKARRLAELVPWSSAAHHTLALALERDGAWDAAAAAHDAAAGRAAGEDERAAHAAAAAHARAEAERARRNRGT